MFFKLKMKKPEAPLEKLAQIDETLGATKVLEAQEKKPEYRPKNKMEKLTDENFPFDPSQIAAVEGLLSSQFGAMTGAAGTGKTTTEKLLVDKLLEKYDIGSVEISKWHRDETDKKFTAAIAIVSFTGKATNVIKRNFPDSWKMNIMTIHQLLQFIPVRDGNTIIGWEPRYDIRNKLPFEVIIIDEAGMLDVELWRQLYAAIFPDTRIYMIGDIQQLPPVHGHSIFPFALDAWKSYELTVVHRQKGDNNRIVENAWKILHGKNPSPGNNVVMLDASKYSVDALAHYVTQVAIKLKEKEKYDPYKDMVIVPTNGHDAEKKGHFIGANFMNKLFSAAFNEISETNPRYRIDVGRFGTKEFAVGDRVMVCFNDKENLLTNGMLGVIKEINENGNYKGDKSMFGKIDETEHEELDFDYTEDIFDNISMKTIEDIDEENLRQASHVVKIDFDGHVVCYGNQAALAKINLGYVATCHKMQGDQADTIIVVLPNAYRAQLYREWFYTALTRAAKYVIIIYQNQAMFNAVNNQKLTGVSLQDKVANLLTKVEGRAKYENLLPRTK